MSLSPGSILAKLDELKKWQNKQQERLLVHHHKQLHESSHSEIQLEVPKTKLDENNPSARPKQPYLRRGTGLGRFRMSPGEQFKPFTNRSRKSVETKIVKSLPRQARQEPLETPTVVLPKAVWEKPSFNDTDRELVIFETLEQRASNASFCSTNSSIVRLLSSSTPRKNSPKAVYAQQSTDFLQVQHVPINNRAVVQENANYEKKIRDDYFNLIAEAMKFKNYIDTNETPPSSMTSATLQADSYNDQSKWTDFEVCSTVSSASSLCSEQVEKIDEEEVEEEAETTIKCDAETMTENNDLNALQDELKEARSDNAKAKKIKEQLEQKSKEFEKYKKEMTKLIEDEKARVGVVLDEEKKKLAKDKMVFERYVKDLHNKPTRKEREEIAALKTEVATLQETLKLKETRHGTTQARLRNQIKALEKENAALKVEIDNLNKQHAKVVVHQRLNAKPSNTKMLNAINKNLSKLTRKQFRKNSKIAESSSEEEDDEEDVLKENDKNSSNTSRTKVEEVYERTFSDPPHNETPKEKDRVEQVLSDGTKQIKYSNGNIKNISSDGNIIIFQYFNGDVKETNLLEGTIRYHYFETKINEITNADGSELIQFPDGQIERRLKSGVREIEYPNNIKRRIHTNGSEEVLYPDGRIVNIGNDERVIILPNGQREIHTDDHKRREYPDGTVKYLYPDGIQETRYTNGRVRMKDKYGKLIMDSQQ